VLHVTEIVCTLCKGHLQEQLNNLKSRQWWAAKLAATFLEMLQWTMQQSLHAVFIHMLYGSQGRLALLLQLAEHLLHWPIDAAGSCTAACCIAPLQQDHDGKIVHQSCQHNGCVPQLVAVPCDTAGKGSSTQPESHVVSCWPLRL